MGGVWYRRKLRGTREASNGGRVRVLIIHGLNINHKELIYLLQKFISPRSKSLLRMLLGEGLVGVNHRAIPISTHKENNQLINHAPTSSHNSSPYAHATGITNLNTSISQIQNYPISMTLISPSSYLKTIIKHQIDQSIQFTSMIVFIILNLDAHHSRTNFITIANTMLF